MDNEHLIPTAQFCSHYNIEISFIESLRDYGLITIIQVQEVPYIEAGQLLQLEKLARMHYDLDINMESLEAISHLLQRVDTLQHELRSLRNRLDFYEK